MQKRRYEQRIIQESNTLNNRKKNHMQIQALRETIDLLNTMNMTILKGDKGYVALSPPNLETITTKKK